MAGWGRAYERSPVDDSCRRERPTLCCGLLCRIVAVRLSHVARRKEEILCRLAVFTFGS
jgi:hypothetical protein